jgi:hypothetical protein
MGVPAMQLLNTLGYGVHQEIGSEVRPEHAAQLSVGLCKNDGILYRAGLKILARASGGAFLSGTDVPTADVVWMRSNDCSSTACMLVSGRFNLLRTTL